MLADPRAPSLVHPSAGRTLNAGLGDGLIGFGESYMVGEWSSKELSRVLDRAGRVGGRVVPRSLHWLRPITPT